MILKNTYRGVMKIACQHLTWFNCTREITLIARQSKLKKTG